MEAYQELESLFGNNAVAVSSGTSALHLALESFKLPSGSKVAVPEFTMIACARAVTMAGLEPVFVDCTSDLLINPVLIPSDVIVIMPVHIYGRRCNMDAIHKLGKLVVEDMAEIHGINPDPRSDAACWSFYKNKIIAGEEGGMITFKHKEHANLARLLRSQGFTEDHDFMHVPRGINARLSNVHAKLILESYSKYEENIKKRREIEKRYDALISEEYHMPSRLSPWVYDIQIPGKNIDEVVSTLKNAGIQARHGFKPMSMQPEYLREYKDLVAYRRSKEVFYLPFNTDSISRFSQMCKSIWNFF